MKMKEAGYKSGIKVGEARAKHRIRELEAQVKGADAVNVRLMERIMELEEALARKDAALGAAEELLAEIAAKYNGGHMYITHTIGQGAERIVAQIRVLKEKKA